MDNKKEYLTYENIQKIEPANVLKFFWEISQIPRESGNEKPIRDYLVNFAKQRNLEYYTDEYFNVIIKKQASCKNKESIAIQAHTDMICEKINGYKHNFSKDPIILYKENDYIKAENTTLGADNGIGVAIILAILDSNNLKTGKIEAIFTVQEETTMLGAKKINLDNIESKKIISLDGGKDGKILVGSANCLEWIGKIKKEFVTISGEYYECELIYKNFKGGHSGGNIGDKDRENPIKLGIDILKQVINNADNFYIKEIFGGSKVNVIPRDFYIKFLIKKQQIDKIQYLVNKQKSKLKNGEIVFKFDNKQNDIVLSREVSEKIINFIYEYKNGVLEYKDNNIVLSCNMAFIREENDFIKIGYSTRSNDIGLRDKYLNNLQKLVDKYKIEIDWSQELYGVEQKLNNSLIKLCSNVYKNMFNKQLEQMITQGVVEGGFFLKKVKDLEYVAIGANIYDAHSPNERVEISSLQNIWNYIKNILQQ